MRRTLTLFVVVVALVTASCDSSVVKVRTDTGQGDSIVVGLDQTIEVELEDNPRFDNANWEWFVVESGVVDLVSMDHVTRPDDEGIGGTWTITFSPIRVGTGDLVLHYRQPGEPDVEPTVEGVAADLALTITVTEP